MVSGAVTAGRIEAEAGRTPLRFSAAMISADKIVATMPIVHQNNFELVLFSSAMKTPFGLCYAPRGRTSPVFKGARRMTPTWSPDVVQAT
jgi:hypothetical protein